MTKTRMQQGDSIRILDPVQVGVRFWDASRRCVVGTHGQAVPRACLEQIGIAGEVNPKAKRVRIVWPVVEDGAATTTSMWLDLDQVARTNPQVVVDRAVLYPQGSLDGR